MKMQLYRTVGFTNSTYMDGSPEVGWKGEFFPTREEAEEAGCGVSESWHSGEETREYIVDGDGVTVDGQPASEQCFREVKEVIDQWAAEGSPRKPE